MLEIARSTERPLGFKLSQTHSLHKLKLNRTQRLITSRTAHWVLSLTPAAIPPQVRPNPGSNENPTILALCRD